MASIFVDGEIVHTIVMPDDIAKSINHLERKAWAVDVLTNYLRQFYGDAVEDAVHESRSHDGKVTGTQAVMLRGNQRIQYMLVEPNKNQGRHEVHVAKLNLPMEEGSVLDIIEHQMNQRRQQKGFNQPFARALAGLGAKVA